MKDTRNKKIKMLAEEVAAAEKQIQLGKDVKSNQEKIENIMCSLEPEELQVLIYLISKKFDFEKIF